MNETAQAVTKEQGSEIRREARRELRALIISGNRQEEEIEKHAQLQTAYTDWFEQWKKQNPEPTDAEQKRMTRDADTIANQARYDAIASQGIDEASVMLELEETKRKSARAEAEVKRLKNRFGLPHGQEEFRPRQLYAIAQKNGYTAKIRAFYDALAKRETGEGTLLSRESAEEFLTDLLSQMRHKTTT